MTAICTDDNCGRKYPNILKLMKCFSLFVLYLMMQLSLSLPAANAAEERESIDAVHSRARFTYESVSLPANEKMGFMGSTVLFDASEWFSLGVGAYGALAGKRGGFITLGGAAEIRQEISDFAEVNSGVFVGAGGGRGGFQLAGGGLMLRYHAGGEIKSEHWGNIGAGVSYVDFPDGTIHSFQPYVSYDYQFDTLHSPGWIEASDIPDYRNSFTPKSEQEFAVVSRTYKVPSGVKQDNGLRAQHPTINLLGIEWNKYVTDDLFIRVESEGAMGGQSTGYMQILFGLGYRIALIKGTWIKLMSSAGVAGGGAVATGGGLLVDATAALQQKLGDHLYAEVAAGYVASPGDSFKALSFAAKLGYHFFTPDIPGEKVYLSDLGGFDPLPMRIRTTYQSYFKAASNWRTHHPNTNVNLLGFQLDYFVAENLFLTGQGIAAYHGKAGAYMTGLVGAGAHLSLFGSPLFVELEALAGAAGGGGLAVGGGLVWQTNAGLGYQFSDAYSVIGTYGYMSAPKGPFRARVLTVSVGYNFSLFIE
jgi:hypothetical protein